MVNLAVDTAAATYGRFVQRHEILKMLKSANCSRKTHSLFGHIPVTNSRSINNGSRN